MNLNKEISFIRFIEGREIYVIWTKSSSLLHSDLIFSATCQHYSSYLAQGTLPIKLHAKR